MRTSAAPDERDPALATLHAALVSLARTMAPILPFLSEQIYQNLIVSVVPSLPDSVHLTSWPTEAMAAHRDDSIEKAMATLRRAVELVSDGDLLWPWDDDSLDQRSTGRGAASAAAVIGDLEAPGPAAASWSVLAPMRVALLDARVAALAGRMPAFAGELVARGARRARALSAQLALSQVPRVDARLHGFLWHLAERHGRVRTDGVLLPLPLTHELLAGLVGARRPSVTTALGQLSRRGAVSRVPEGWLLGGSP